MVTISVDLSIIDYATRLVNKFNFGQRRAGFNGTRDQQITGMIGQSTICRALGRDLPAGGAYDGGYDIILGRRRADIKTMGRTVEMRPWFVHNYTEHQILGPAEILILCSYNSRSFILTLCGWLPKKDFIQRAAYFPKGAIRTRQDGTSFQLSAGLYELGNNSINDVSSIIDLSVQTGDQAAPADPDPIEAIKSEYRQQVQAELF